MLPMSVVTMAFFGMAFSSSRSARRGTIGEPSFIDQSESSFSHACCCFFTSARRASLLPCAAMLVLSVCSRCRISAAALPASPCTPTCIGFTRPSTR